MPPRPRRVTDPHRAGLATRGALPETEAGWLGWVLDAARDKCAAAARWEVYHTHDSRHSPAGFPDLVLVRPPRVIFAELKTATGRVTADQWRWRDLLDGCPGVECYLWRPYDRDEILRVLAR
jgi:hypothetical protein